MPPAISEPTKGPLALPARVVVPGEMRGKGRPRFAKRGNFVQAYTDTRTETAENWVKSCALDQLGRFQPLDGPLIVSIEITVAVAASWSKKKQAQALAGQIRPTGKPDLDNCVKLIADALNKIVWQDDSQIVRLIASKRYGAAAETALLVRAAEGHI